MTTYDKKIYLFENYIFNILHEYAATSKLTMARQES